MADAYLGQPEPALAELNNLADAGLVGDFKADDMFSSLRGLGAR